MHAEPAAQGTALGVIHDDELDAAAPVPGR